MRTRTVLSTLFVLLTPLLAAQSPPEYYRTAGLNRYQTLFSAPATTVNCLWVTGSQFSLITSSLSDLGFRIHLEWILRTILVPREFRIEIRDDVCPAWALSTW